MAVPEYSVCKRCGEIDGASLRMVKGHVLCANCAATGKSARCSTCGKLARCESHHIAGRLYIPPIRLRICLNCHAILSARQYAWVGWREGEYHPVRYLLQGISDIKALWWERGTEIDYNRDLMIVFGRVTHYVQIALLGLGSQEL